MLKRFAQFLVSAVLTAGWLLCLDAGTGVLTSAAEHVLLAASGPQCAMLVDEGSCLDLSHVTDLRPYGPAARV